MEKLGWLRPLVPAPKPTPKPAPEPRQDDDIHPVGPQNIANAQLKALCKELGEALPLYEDIDSGTEANQPPEWTSVIQLSQGPKFTATGKTKKLAQKIVCYRALQFLEEKQQNAPALDPTTQSKQRQNKAYIDSVTQVAKKVNGTMDLTATVQPERRNVAAKVTLYIPVRDTSYLGEGMGKTAFDAQEVAAKNLWVKVIKALEQKSDKT